MVSVLPPSDNFQTSVVLISKVCPLRSPLIVELTVSASPSADHVATDDFFIPPNTVLSAAFPSNVSFSEEVTASPLGELLVLSIVRLSPSPLTLIFAGAGRKR